MPDDIPWTHRKPKSLTDAIRQKRAADRRKGIPPKPKSLADARRQKRDK